MDYQVIPVCDMLFVYDTRIVIYFTVSFRHILLIAVECCYRKTVIHGYPFMTKREFLQRMFLAGIGGALYTMAPPICHLGARGFAQDTEIYNEDFELIIPTFLGNDRRAWYGQGEPQGLNVIRRFWLGIGETSVGGEFREWKGAGWTGQPTLVRDRGRVYLVQGAFDHGLHRIDLESFSETWRYGFDDVIKGTATIYIDHYAPAHNRIVILQGSRRGLHNTINTPGPVPSFRAISFRTGQELWRMDIPLTDSYSRDNDASPILLDDGVLFNPGENGIGYFLNAAVEAASVRDGILQPEILDQVYLYVPSDMETHRRNLVSEASPARLGNRIYLACGSGHIFGIDIATRQIAWDFYTGSDMDGSTVINYENKIFASIEKQYIPGKGGIIKLNPALPPEQSVEWFFPVENRDFVSWQGGVIGSVAVNDAYIEDDAPPLFATGTIEGSFYIGSQLKTTGEQVDGFLLDRSYPTPKIVFQADVGPTISTPIFTEGNKVIWAGYYGMRMYQLHFESCDESDPDAVPTRAGGWVRVRVEEIAHHDPEDAGFEATPIAWQNRLYVAAKDGYLYEFG